MVFLDNKTDRRTLGMITKSMSDDDIKKSMYNSGLVQVERMVNKPGVKPFQEKFWVNPDEVKKTDMVLYMPPNMHTSSTTPKPKEDKWKPIEFPEGFNVDNLITNETKISERTMTGKSLKKMINHGLDILCNERLSWFMSEQGCDMDVHINSIDGNMVHLQIVTSLYADEVSDSDKRDLRDTLRWDIFDNPDQEVNIFEKDDQLAVETTINFKDVVETFRDVEITEFLGEFLKKPLSEVTEKVKNLPDETIERIINRDITTPEEKKLFAETLKNSTKEQLKAIRLTGMAADLKDKAAMEYIERISEEFIEGYYTHQILENVNGKYDDVYDTIDSIPYAELVDTLENWNDNGTPFKVEFDPMECIKNNSLKTKISKANPRITDIIKQRVKDQWDKKEHKNMDYEIKGIYAIEHMPVFEEYNKIVEQNIQYKDETAGGKNCQRALLYHGTDPAATVMILGHSGQFIIPKKAKAGRMWGDAVYAASKSSKSAQYVGKQFARHNVTGTLMVCEASLGKCFWNDHLDYTEIPPSVFKEYDSIGVEANKFTGVKNREYAIFNSKAIVPKYLVELKLK